MNKQLEKDGLVWGSSLWLFGYILGIVLFMFVPQTLIGWIVSPIGIVAILWVLTKKVKGNKFEYFLKLAIVWTLIALIFDYLFLVQLFKPADGYYKLDVYLYYAFTFLLPLVVGWFKFRKGEKNEN